MSTGGLKQRDVSPCMSQLKFQCQQNLFSDLMNNRVLLQVTHCNVLDFQEVVHCFLHLPWMIMHCHCPVELDRILESEIRVKPGKRTRRKQKKKRTTRSQVMIFRILKVSMIRGSWFWGSDTALLSNSTPRPGLSVAECKQMSIQISHKAPFDFESSSATHVHV